MVSVHLDKNSKIEIQKTNGLSSDSLIRLGELCNVFLTTEHLLRLKLEIDKRLNGSSEKVY